MFDGPTRAILARDYNRLSAFPLVGDSEPGVDCRDDQATYADHDHGHKLYLLQRCQRGKRNNGDHQRHHTSSSIVALIVDPPGKARHCTLMLLAASVLADCAPEDNQQRALARYTFLYADALLEWARRWRNQLKHDSVTRARAQAAKPAVQELATVLDTADGVRDYLAAKRQPGQAMRADDIETTAALWVAVNPYTVQTICAAAIRAYDELNQARDQSESVVQLLGLPP